jgi:hypothetical protein
MSETATKHATEHVNISLRVQDLVYPIARYQRDVEAGTDGALEATVLKQATNGRSHTSS